MHDYWIDVLTLAPVIFVLIGLTVAVALDNCTRVEQRRMLLLILLVEFLLVVQNYAGYLMEPLRSAAFAKTIISLTGYILRPLMFVLFFRLVAPDKRFWPAWVLIGLNAAVYLTALFSRAAFYFDENSTFHRGPLGFTCFYISAVLFVYLIWLTISENRRLRMKALSLPLLSDLFITAAVLFDLFSPYRAYPISAFTIALICGSVLYYIWLHLLFEREHERELLNGQYMQIMLSQIQPHFLYNSLGAIRDTYRSDTRRGEQAITEFAEYLRHNMDSLTQEQPIPFTEELDHVRSYLNLQKLRFGDDLNVAYDLESMDFRLPTLTLQPLVENAVTYGVRKNETGRGTVTIRSREYPDRWEVSVTDDGPGFVPDSLPGDSERSHVGLRNVRERLKHTCGGELRIDSTLGEGTTATIILPKQDAI